MKQCPNMCRKFLQINFMKLSKNSASSVAMLEDLGSFILVLTKHSSAHPVNIY